VIKGLRRNGYLFQAMLRKYGVKGSAELLFNDVLYDVRKGTDTVLPINEAQLFEADKHDTHKKYAPSPFSLIRESIRTVEQDIDLSRSNFVDYGSGKGKVLIGAAEFPFVKLKGVEFSTHLHEIAQRNVDKLGLNERMELLNIDAGLYVPAPQDRLFYFFNPFVGEVLDRCLQRIADTHEADNRRALLYANPRADEQFQHYFTKVAEYAIQPGNVRVFRYEKT